MSHIPLITTGLNGLVGSKFGQIFANNYDITNLDLTHPTHPTDITDAAQVLSAFKASPAEFVVHFAAFTDVNGAWQQRDDKNGPAWQVNVNGTHNLQQAAEQTGKRLIHISTAYIFDGEKDALYTEADQPNPIEWYGQTKWEAEKIVQASQTPWTILRIDQPFRSDVVSRPDLVRRIITGIQSGSLYPQFTNHFIGPTFIDDFAKVIDWVIRTRATGVYHATSGEKWSDYEFAKQIVKTFGFEYDIQPGNVDEYLKTIQRPYQRNTSLNCDKLIAQLDFKMLTIEQALKQVKL